MISRNYIAEEKGEIHFDKSDHTLAVFEPNGLSKPKFKKAGVYGLVSASLIVNTGFLDNVSREIEELNLQEELASLVGVDEKIAALIAMGGAFTSAVAAIGSATCPIQVYDIPLDYLALAEEVRIFRYIPGKIAEGSHPTSRIPGRFNDYITALDVEGIIGKIDDNLTNTRMILFGGEYSMPVYIPKTFLANIRANFDTGDVIKVDGYLRRGHGIGRGKNHLRATRFPKKVLEFKEGIIQ